MQPEIIKLMFILLLAVKYEFENVLLFCGFTVLRAAHFGTKIMKNLTCRIIQFQTKELQV